MRTLLIPLVLCACGSSSSSQPPDVDATPSCVPANEVVDLAADHGWAVQSAVSADARGPWLVVDKRKTGASSRVILDRTGEVATLASGLPDNLRIAPVVVDGKRCIAMHALDETFSFACEDGTLETPAFELGGDMRAVASGGTIHVFGQQFAAYHELRRVAGTWREVEKFESSISKAEDAIPMGSTFASCFLSTGGSASVDYDADIAYGMAAKWCRLIPGDSIGVLTDQGLATFTGTAIGAPTTTALADMRPTAVGRVAGNPVAVVTRGLSVELQPLPSGTPVMLRTLANSAENVQAAVLSDRVVVMSLRAILDGSATRYQLITSTHCL